MRLRIVGGLAVLLTFWAPCVYATSAYQRDSFGSASAATTTTTTAMTTVAGDAVIVVGMVKNGQKSSRCPCNTTGSTDTLTLVAENDDANGYTAIYANYSVAGGSSTYTFNVTTASDIEVWAYEFSGNATASGFDVAATQAFVTCGTGTGCGPAGTTTNGVTSGTTATLAQADEYCVAAWMGDSSGARTHSSTSNSFAFGTNGNQLNNGVIGPAAVAYKVVSSQAAVETTEVATGSWSATGAVACFKGATSFVQAAFGQTASALSVSVTLTTTAGHGIIVTLVTGNQCISDGNVVTTGSTDTLSLVQTQGDNTAGCTKQYVNCNIVGGSSTYQASWDNTASPAGIFAAEVKGQLTSACSDKNNVEAGSTSTTHTITATATLAQSREIAIAVWNMDGSGGSGPLTVDSGFTVPVNGNQGDATCNGTTCQNRAMLAFVDTSATTGVGVTLTSVSAPANGIIGTYKLAAAATCSPTMTLLGVGRCG